MKLTTKAVPALFLTALQMLCTSAEAGTLTFTNRAAFQSAATGVRGIYTDAMLWPPWKSEGPELAFSGVTFNARYLFYLRPQSSGVTNRMVQSLEDLYPIQLTFDTPVLAVGAYYTTHPYPEVSAFTATLTLDSGQQFVFDAPTYPATQFFGFILDSPITSMTFSDGGISHLISSEADWHAEMVGDLFVVQVIPEPSTAALMLAGFAVCSVVRRRRG